MNSHIDRFDVQSLQKQFGHFFNRPVTLEEDQVLPAYYLAGGFGVTSSDDTNEAEDGNALGGGGVAVPLGVYVRQGGEIRFRPNPVIVMLAAIPFVGMIIGLIKHPLRP